MDIDVQLHMVQSHRMVQMDDVDKVVALPHFDKCQNYARSRGFLQLL